MEQIVQVRQTYADGMAQVVHVRQSACSGNCHQCAGCGSAEETLMFTASNPLGAVTGDVVRIESASAPVLRGAAVMYMLPLALFFLGYLLGSLTWQLGALTGGIAFLLGIALVILYDRRVAAKQKTVYTITGFVAESRKKGENDFD